ncbi:MAG: tetratricopeptide repeat protein [Negativicutes bacterium]|nr:tetratricopeptide repeat protein [Negativicutes bacterium]
MVLKPKRRLPLFLFFLLILMIFVLPSPGYAEGKEIVAEGTYVMGDGETPLIAEERALVAAKRTALEQAGTYVQSYSATKNYQLTADEVQVIASGIMEVTTLDKRRTVEGGGINFWVKIKALVTTDKIEDMAAKVKEMSLGEDYKKLQENYDKSQQEIAALKQQLQQTNSDKDRQQIRTEITARETLFQADTWLDRGNRRMAKQEYYEAINAYTEAINLNPNYGRAYYRRGIAHGAVGEYQEAVNDFIKATDNNPNLFLAYFAKGHALEKLGYRREAIAAYRTFISYATPEQHRRVEWARYRIRLLQRGY